MKKKYIIPELLLVKLGCTKIIAASLQFKQGTISDESQVCTKENNGAWGDIWD